MAFGPTIPSAGWTSIRRRSSVRWRVPSRELAACSGLGGAGSESITGVGFGLAGVPTRSMAAGPWFGLGGAGGIRPGCGGMLLGQGRSLSIFEFFFLK